VLSKLWGGCVGSVGREQSQDVPRQPCYPTGCPLPHAPEHQDRSQRAVAEPDLPNPYRPTPPYLPGAISGALAMGMGAVGKP